MTTAADNGKSTSLAVTSTPSEGSIYAKQEGKRLVYDHRAPLTQAEAHREAKAQGQQWGKPPHGARVVNCQAKPGPIDISIHFGSETADSLARAHAFCPTCDGLGLVGDAANLYPTPCQFCDGTGLKDRHLDAYHDRAIADYTRAESGKPAHYVSESNPHLGRRHDDFDVDFRPVFGTILVALVTLGVLRFGGDLVRWVESWGWLS